MTRTDATFDRDYYQRFYTHPRTRIGTRAETARLARFVCSAVDYYGIAVRRVLDAGCGLGYFRDGIAQVFPRARYTGLEVSEYLCEKHGFELGSVVDYRAAKPFDLVICRGVLPYLDDADAKRALRNLAKLTAGALYLEAVTREDFRADVVDRARSDGAMRARPRAFYASALARHFDAVGGGIYLAKRAGVPLFALERADR